MSRSARPRSAGSSRRRGAPAGQRFSPRRLVPQALVVAVLVAGTTAFVSYDKTVTLVVDGHPRTVHTFATTVAGVLDKQHVNTGAHDVVAPGRSAGIDDGDRIAVSFGRPVQLDLDNEHRQVWVTARTVDEALDQLGVRSDGAWLSVSRSAPIGRAGLDLAVRTERTVTFLVDGRTVPVHTNAATLSDAAAQAHITMGPKDRISVPMDTFPLEGMQVAIVRVVGTTMTRDEPIPFETHKQDDPTQFKGEQTVVTKGVPGVRRTTFLYETVDGVKQQPHKVKDEVIRQPVTQVIKVGTKERPNSVAGADGLNWGALAQCEAGGNPRAVDPTGTYSGLYQFDAQTWQSLGGSGTAGQAPASEQTYRAKLLYAQRGASPWPVCGSRL